MKELSVKEWLASLGSRTPVPGGGAVSGFDTAISAAALKMVCEYSTGPKYASVENDMRAHIDSLDGLVADGLEQAEADVQVYSRLREAYSMPAGTEKEKSEKSAAVQEALQKAVQPSLQIIRIVDKIVKITDDINDKSNANLASDVAVSAANAKSALEAAIVNIEINAIQIKDGQLKEDLSDAVTKAEGLIEGLDSMIKTIRKKIKERE